MKHSMRTLLLSSAVLFNVSANANTVENFFVNGIANDYEDRVYSALYIQEKAKIGTVYNLHNGTKSVRADLGESVKMVFNWDRYYEYDGSVNSDYYIATTLKKYFGTRHQTRKRDTILYKWAGVYLHLKKKRKSTKNFLRAIRTANLSCNLYNFKPMSNMGFDLLKDCREMRRIPRAQDLVVALGEVSLNKGTVYMPTNPERSDISKMLNVLNYKTSKSIDAGKNIIAHSQGNLFASRLVAKLKEDGKKVKYFSVATPERKGNVKDKYVTLEEDIVSWSFAGSKPSNMKNYTLPKWQQKLGVSSYSIANSKFYKYKDFKNGKRKSDSLGHGFVTSYLKPRTNSERFILSNFRKNYHSLKNSDLTGGSNSTRKSDLFVKNARLSANTIPERGKVKAYATHQYSGTVKSRNLPSYPRLGYYISKDRNWGRGDVFLDYDKSRIGSDRTSESESEWLTMPRSITSGDYYILFIADYRGVVTEINEMNNVIAIPIKIGNGASSTNGGNDDIYLSSPRVYDKTLYRGQRVKLRVNVCYRGDSKYRQVGKTYLGYYISTKSYFDRKATRLSSDYSTIGTDDRCDGESTYVTVPSPLRTGTYYIHFVADYKKSVKESDENNNVSSVKVSIR